MAAASAYQTIVVGYDGTRSAELALARAALIAGRAGSKLVVVDVVPPTPVDGVDGAYGLMPYSYSSYSSIETEQATDEAIWNQHRAKAEEFLSAGGIDYEFAGVVGQPAGELVDVAAQRQAGLIVVGTREPGFFERMFGGSVSQGVAKHARCDVLIVHPPDDAD
jgi:nucleotide-binding universal stress UspA family protein